MKLKRVGRSEQPPAMRDAAMIVHLSLGPAHRRAHECVAVEQIVSPCGATQHTQIPAREAQRQFILLQEMHMAGLHRRFAQRADKLAMLMPIELMIAGDIYDWQRRESCRRPLDALRA